VAGAFVLVSAGPSVTQSIQSTYKPKLASLKHMEPILVDALDISAVAGARWDAAPRRNSEDLIRRVGRTQTSSTIVVNLPKRVTSKEVRELVRDFKRELAADQPGVILDLSDVKEMDTAGLDLLVQFLEDTLSRDGTISLRGISPEAVTILELTGVDRVLNMFSEGSEGGANSESGHVAALLEDRTPKQVAA
jgi:anti-anti-sigma factor